MKFVARIIAVLLLATGHAHAFALLGPFEPWMDATNCLRLPGDIGGALDIAEEYRWNVPVVTYGFDQSFLDYFGSNGTAAVEQAIQIVNNLPPASNLQLGDFPTTSFSYNYLAQALGLQDLKSVTLTLVLEQMGLAEPTTHVFDLRRWSPAFLTDNDEASWWPWAYPDFILERNFDPESLASSHYVNQTLYSGYVLAFAPPNPYPSQATVLEFPVDPLAEPFNAVRDRAGFFSGEFATGLTRDDAGGLRYLLSSSNINFETLLADVQGVGTNATSWVDGAWRPGVEKITFVSHPFDPLLGRFLPFTNQYADDFITNGLVSSQLVERVTMQPDFLFCVSDTGENEFSSPLYTRTGTSNWLSHSAGNGSPLNTGPGIIRPPVRITFNKEAARKFTSDNYPHWISDYSNPWGSFDSSTNLPVIHPSYPPPNSDALTVRLRLFPLPYTDLTNGISYTWQVPVAFGGTAILQFTTNLTSWETLGVVVNNGGVFEWQHQWTMPQRFFRVVPQ